MTPSYLDRPKTFKVLTKPGRNRKGVFLLCYTIRRSFGPCGFGAVWENRIREPVSVWRAAQITLYGPGKCMRMSSPDTCLSFLRSYELEVTKCSESLFGCCMSAIRRYCEDVTKHLPCHFSFGLQQPTAINTNNKTIAAIKIK